MDSSPHPRWLQSIEEAAQSSRSQPDWCLMIRGITVVGPQTALVGSQATSLVGSVTLISRYWIALGSRIILDELKSQKGGRQGPPSPLVPGLSHLAIENRLAALIMVPPYGTRKLMRTRLRPSSPTHFLWTWTLAYSEKDGSGLGADDLGTRLRWTMSRSA